MLLCIAQPTGPADCHDEKIVGKDKVNPQKVLIIGYLLIVIDRTSTIFLAKYI
jgi:hypothetical protein